MCVVHCHHPAWSPEDLAQSSVAVTTSIDRRILIGQPDYQLIHTVVQSTSKIVIDPLAFHPMLTYVYSQVQSNLDPTDSIMLLSTLAELLQQITLNDSTMTLAIVCILILMCWTATSVLSSAMSLEIDHNAAMSLHKWHTEDNDAMTMSTYLIRIAGENGMQWHSPVTIMNSQITMHAGKTTITTLALTMS
eukprot:1220106-Amphidinium_carterae.3